MRYLTLGEVVALHRAIVAATGGAEGICDLGALESALAQPKATFDRKPFSLTDPTNRASAWDHTPQWCLRVTRFNRRSSSFGELSLRNETRRNGIVSIY